MLTRSKLKQNSKEQNDHASETCGTQQTEVTGKSQKTSGTVRSRASVERAIKEAEFIATQKLAQLNNNKIEQEQEVIKKQLELDIARIKEEHSSIASSRSNRSRSRSSDVTQPPSQKVEQWIYNQDVQSKGEFQNNHLNANIKPDTDPNNSPQSDIKLLALEINKLRRPVQNELQVFSGNTFEWISFKAAYTDTQAQLSDQENIARLRRCLKGDAREAVAAMLHCQVSPGTIMETLEQRFGRPELILQEQIGALKEFPRLSESVEQLSRFACRVRNCVATIQALKRPEYLYNLELVQALKSKMICLKSRWLTYALKHERDPEPELLKIADFLQIEASTTSKFWLLETRPSTSRGTFHKTLVAEEDPKIEEDCYFTSTNNTWNCPYCDSHYHKNLHECETFKKLNTDERWNWAKENRFCFKCLRSKHRRENCKGKLCGINGCKMPHNPLLHAQQIPVPSQSNAILCPETSENKSEPCTSKDLSEVTATCNGRSHVLLKLIPIIAQGPKGSKRTYALLDGGSTLTLVKHSLIEQLNITGPTEPLVLAGINATTENVNSKRVNLKIQGLSSEEFELTNARTILHLPLSNQTFTDTHKYNHLKDLPTDTTCYEHAVPEILIGQDNWHTMITTDVRKGLKNEPVASLTPLGWVIHGFCHTSNIINFVGHTDESLHKTVEQYFKIDSLGVTTKKKLSPDDEQAIQILQNTARRIDNGKRWEVGLLWRDSDTKMPESFKTAYKRLISVEKKMDKDRQYGEKYKENVEIFLNKGYAGPCEPSDSPVKFYLPHFGVTNVNKPGKLRIVHDAACKVNGTSLNDKLLTGPDLLLSLLGILFKFREGRIAMSADIREMFLQVCIRPEDRVAQRFLWRGWERCKPPQEYEMKSVIFGATSSPATAIYIKDRNAEDFRDQYPEAVNAIKTRFYMDDYLHSMHSELEALKMMKEVSKINSEGGFELTQWMSNSTSVMNAVDPEKKGTGNVNLDFNVSVKILGLRWNPADDTLGFNLNLSKISKELQDGTNRPTKRQTLKILMSVFDPLGLITPIIIQGKILLQLIWRSGIDWDQKLGDAEAAHWKKWVNKLNESWTCRVPRCYDAISSDSTVQLHVFCDASEMAFAAVAYWRFSRPDGKITVTLIGSKSRVSPLKPLSIPRLELQAALLGARLLDTVTREHDTLKPSARYLWTDSSTVIAWLKNDPRSYKTYVSHRLGEIAELTRTNEWRWVPTNQNVADDATREIEHLDANHRWFRGPPFLYESEDNWPRQTQPIEPSKDFMELKKQVHLTITITESSSSLPDISRFSMWLKLIRSTAYVLLFAERLQKKTTSGILPHHLETAEELWIKRSQRESFPEELLQLSSRKALKKSSRLSKLSCHLDKNNIIRLTGRTTAASDIQAINPVILDGKHVYTKLMTQHFHAIMHHGSCETVVNELRQKYWIIHLRPTVKSVERACQTCKIRRASPACPPEGDLPPSRLAHHQRPFTHCGLDYFGPMLVTIGRRKEKRYGALFTCMTSRALHIEIAGSLTTDSTILALRRMMARRGCPRTMYSDNGTNFRGANTELKKAIQDLDQDKLKDFLVNKGVEWRFNPPASPHMGGCWERLVRSVKNALKVTLKDSSPSEEILHTVLIEAEHIINSRPLTHVSVNPEDPEALTPNHFLIGSSSGVPLPGSFNEKDLLTRKYWRKSQGLADLFWKRWIIEYLPTLQPRPSTDAVEDLHIGDVVILVDQNMPRNVWPRGVIERVFPGPDGRVRVAEVRTAGGVLKRPAVKLVPIVRQCANGQRH